MLYRRGGCVMEALAETQSRPNPILKSAQNRFRILIVDDDYMVRQYVKDVLESHYDVKCLATGLNIKNLLQDLRPDLIILDIMLPWIDGFELCQTIRSEETKERLPIIFLTGEKRREADFLQALEVGGNAYMTKPFSPQELLKRIRELLNENDL